MKYTLDELKDYFNQVLIDNGYSTGLLSTIIVSLLSNFTYAVQLIDINILKESSFLSSKLLNSKIQHAADNFYSIGRGRNLKIHVTGLTSTMNNEVKKYDVLQTFGNYKLIYASDYKFRMGDYCEIDLWIAQNIITEDTIGNSELSKTVRLNLSDDISIFENNNDNLMELETTKNIDDITYKTSAILDITIPNYFIKLFNKNVFTLNKVYTIKGLSVPDENESIEDLSTINNLIGFNFSGNLEEGRNYSVVQKTQYRLSDPDMIYLNTKNRIAYDEILKSNGSLDDITLEFLNEYYPDIKKFNIVATQNDIFIYYIVSYNREDYIVDSSDPSGYRYVYNGDPSKLIDEEHQEYFKNNYLSRYNITANNIEFKPAVLNMEIFKNANPIQDSEFNITIKYKNDIDYSEVRNTIDNYQYRIGKRFDTWSLISSIMTNEKLKNIVYIQVGDIVGDSASNQMLVQNLFPDEFLQILKPASTKLVFEVV